VVAFFTHLFLRRCINKQAGIKIILPNLVERAGLSWNDPKEGNQGTQPSQLCGTDLCFYAIAASSSFCISKGSNGL
jgi:hypothetical protein